MNVLELYTKCVSDILKTMRAEYNLDVNDIAEKIGVSPGTYRNLESGQRIPTVSQIEGLAELFNSTFEEFIKVSIDLFEKELTKEETLKNLSGKDYREGLCKVYELTSAMKTKWRKDKESLSDRASEATKDLIQLCQKFHTNNKYLNEADINELTEEIMTLTDLRVQQILRKRKKA